ncbi:MULTISPECIES: hypothetical protein [unclassified Streptomyces]|nr:hypothetical protein [Streptomyces sp. NRRL F-2747]
MLPKTPWPAGPRPAAATTPHPGPRALHRLRQPARHGLALPAGPTGAGRP